MKRLAPALLCVILALAAAAEPGPAPASPAAVENLRLYDGVAAYLPNPSGTAFAIELEVRDLNLLSRAPAELLLKIYDPAGRLHVREVLPDDGVVAPAYAPPVSGWDHEAWYRHAALARGLEPMLSWSALTEPARLAGLPARHFRYTIPPGAPGVWRLLVSGGPDHVVTLRLTPARPVALAGTVNWLHGQGDRFRRSYIYVPRGAKRLDLVLAELDSPPRRSLRLLDPDGKPVPLRAPEPPGEAGEGGEEPVTSSAPAAYREWEAWFPAPGAYDDRVLTLEAEGGSNAFLLTAAFAMGGETPLKRLKYSANALFAPNPETARAAQGGALYHDGRTFWHGFQIRYHDWLKTLKPEDLETPPGLAGRPGFHSVGSHQSPAKDSADRILHDYPAHRDRLALNKALAEMANGLNAIGPGDIVLQGPMKNLAYEMGCYSFFYHRPAWRILRDSDAPEAAKGPIREFILAVGDRLAFCRGGELINGNALASLVEALRYCAEASDDPLQKALFDAYWDRFAHGGFGERIGIGPSGAIQESFGYDHNYGSYVLRGWRAVNEDLRDPRFLQAYDRVLALYSYTHSEGGVEAAPWSSRTQGGTAGGTYSPTNEAHRWKGYGGPDFTVGVNGGNEFFAARRPGYYVLTYHGRLAPSWFTEGFHGQVGYGGGMICQLHIPGRGQVLGSSLNGAYGAGMHPSQWREFHLHSVVGTLPDGSPLVSANSEHPDARLEGNVLSSSGEIRQAGLRVLRDYRFEADRIACRVRLAPSASEPLFDLYGGRSAFRGRVAEAWEMIPVANPAVPRKGKRGPVAALTALDGEGAPLGPLTTGVVSAASVVIDRGGFGCRVRFAKPAEVRLGERDTLLVRLAGSPVPAGAIDLAYELIPFSEQQPASSPKGP